MGAYLSQKVGTNNSPNPTFQNNQQPTGNYGSNQAVKLVPQDSTKFNFDFQDKVKDSSFPTPTPFVHNENEYSKIGGTTATSNIVEPKQLNLIKGNPPIETSANNFSGHAGLYNSVSSIQTEKQEQLFRNVEQRSNRIR